MYEEQKTEYQDHNLDFIIERPIELVQNLKKGSLLACFKGSEYKGKVYEFDTANQSFDIDEHAVSHFLILAEDVNTGATKAKCYLNGWVTFEFLKKNIVQHSGRNFEMLIKELFEITPGNIKLI